MRGSSRTPTKSLDDRLLDAARLGRVASVRKRLQEGANPRARTHRDERISDYEVPVLVVAALRGHREVVELLLDSGAHLEDAPLRYHAGIFTEDPMETAGATALWIAANRGDLPLVSLLVRRGANLEALNESDNGGRPIDAATRQGHGAVVQCLRDAGARGSQTA